jgi:hypothetical protein
MTKTLRQQNIDKYLDELLLAINDPGPHPIAHQAIMNKSRREWPTLWRTIDNLLVAKNIRE